MRKRAAAKKCGQPAGRHPADRYYSPVEAAFAATQYLNFDPSFFLQETALAGMALVTDGREIHHFEVKDIKVDGDLAAFLWCWMKFSKGGMPLRELLMQRELVI